MNKDTLENLKPFLYGKLLGDAYLKKIQDKNSCLKIEHSIKQEEYFLHCYYRIHNFCNKWTRQKRKQVYKGKVTINESLTTYTRKLPVFTELRTVWYINNKKVLPKDIEKYFTEETLAYWLMDDGTTEVVGNYIRVRFCTESFSKEENIKLLNILKNKFNLKAKLLNYKTSINKECYRIEISKKENCEKLFSLVEKFIVPSMKYKIRTSN